MFKSPKKNNKSYYLVKGTIIIRNLGGSNYNSPINYILNKYLFIIQNWQYTKITLNQVKRSNLKYRRVLSTTKS